MPTTVLEAKQSVLHFTPTRDFKIFNHHSYCLLEQRTKTPTPTDKTCKLWDAETGDLLHTYRGHATEIVCLSFDPPGLTVATGSMDNTARLWDVETGTPLHTLVGLFALAP